MSTTHHKEIFENAFWGQFGAKKKRRVRKPSIMRGKKTTKL